MSASAQVQRCLTSLGAALLAAVVAADEIRMPNGELLTGKLISENETTIVFESDSFGRLELPKSPAIAITKANPGGTPGGAASPAAADVPATGNESEGDSGKPAWLQAISPHPDRWTYDLKVGLDFLRGEVELNSYNVETTLGYKVAPHEFGLFGAFEETKLFDADLDKSTEIIGRYFYREEDAKWMLLTQADWLRDRINLTEYRYNFFLVPSYRFIDQEHRRFLVGVGPSYRTEARIVDTGDTFTEVDHESFRVAAYQVFQYNLPPRWRFRETLLVQVDPDTSENLGIRFNAMLSYDLTEFLSLNLEYEVVEDTNEAFIEQKIRTLNLMIGYGF